MAYLDSNVFIYPVVASLETEQKARLAKEVLVRVVTGELDAETSSLTWDEFVWNVRWVAGREVALEEGRRLLGFPNLDIIAAKESTVRLAQDLSGTYELDPQDSIHAASALQAEAKEMVTDDPDFDVVEELKRVKLEEF